MKDVAFKPSWFQKPQKVIVFLRYHCPLKSWQSFCNHPLSIWRHHHTQPSPRWSEANLPTPLCRILGIAAYRAAVMCHLVLGPIGEELFLTSPLKVVCHREPCWGKISEGHLRTFSWQWEQPWGRVSTPIGKALPALFSPKAHEVALPQEPQLQIKDWPLGWQPTDHSVPSC